MAGTEPHRWSGTPRPRNSRRRSSQAAQDQPSVAPHPHECTPNAAHTRGALAPSPSVNRIVQRAAIALFRRTPSWFLASRPALRLASRVRLVCHGRLAGPRRRPDRGSFFCASPGLQHHDRCGVAGPIAGEWQGGAASHRRYVQPDGRQSAFQSDATDRSAASLPHRAQTNLIHFAPPVQLPLAVRTRAGVSDQVLISP